MGQDVWSPAQYERFRDERAQPFFDLMALVRPSHRMSVLDLGCGTGELTRLLHERLQALETLGIDNSPKMLEKSEAHAADGLTFQLGDIADFRSAPRFDLIFSNAALQWVPGHEKVLDSLTSSLRNGGQLAIQMPANYDHPSHTVAAEVAAEEPFREALGAHVRRSPVLEPERYALLLDRLGYRGQHVQLHVYGHHLASREEVVEWVKGTLLTDYQRRLPVELYDEFLASYRARLLPRLDDTHPYFFIFKRILLWAAR
ncbi:MAG: methyltransferase domain-containing protein [Acidobacteria bacterium]|nr:methyltransferase domain-containing protein [Acidobacteriota bacterium]